MSREDAAQRLRDAISKSKNWGVGWILNGDDGVLQAVRDFDSAWSRSVGKAAGEGE